MGAAWGFLHLVRHVLCWSNMTCRYMVWGEWELPPEGGGGGGGGGLPPAGCEQKSSKRMGSGVAGGFEGGKEGCRALICDPQTARRTDQRSCLDGPNVGGGGGLRIENPDVSAYAQWVLNWGRSGTGKVPRAEHVVPSPPWSNGDLKAWDQNGLRWCYGGFGHILGPRSAPYLDHKGVDHAESMRSKPK
jgi:hypothetical protein